MKPNPHVGDESMPHNSWAIIGAFLSLAVLYLAGVVLLLDPIAVGDAPTGPLIPLPMAFVIAIAVYVALFVWVEQRMRSPFSAAMTIAFSQFALVNVDYVLSGKRGFATAAASTVILFVSWSVVAVVYARLRTKTEATAENHLRGTA
jgi:uncharacterized membrane protein YesL